MRIDGLTIVRFFAALWVFVFHFDLRIPLGAPEPIARVISNGALAMPIFFMLSGFVIAYRYREKYHGFSSFFRARVARIYPAYLVGVIACLPFLASQKGIDWMTMAFVIPIDLLIIQAWYPNLWSFWHHGGTWSISVEMFLYAMFPLMLSFGKLQTRALLMICTLCVLMAGSFVPSLNSGASSEIPFPVFYAIPIYSLPSFVIGIALAELHRRGHRGLSIAPIAFFLVLAFAGQFNERYSGLNIITLPLIALTLLFAARPSVGAPSQVRKTITRALVYLGDISYAFFVYQIPLTLLLQHYLKEAQAFPVYAVFLLTLGLNVSLAAISHRWIEPFGSRLVFKYWRGRPADAAGQVAGQG